MVSVIENVELLAEQCEKATGPDRRLDAMIGAAVRAMPISDPDAWLAGWPQPFVAAKFAGSIAAPDRNGNMVCHWEARAYTASLDAAMTLVPYGWDFIRLERQRSWPNDPRGDCWLLEAALMELPGSGYAKTSARTGSLALCAAALRARSTPSPSVGD